MCLKWWVDANLQCKEAFFEASLWYNLYVCQISLPTFEEYIEISSMVFRSRLACKNGVGIFNIWRLKSIHHIWYFVQCPTYWKVAQFSFNEGVYKVIYLSNIRKRDKYQPYTDQRHIKRETHGFCLASVLRKTSRYRFWKYR